LQACQAALAIDGQWYEAAKELVRALLSAKRHDEAVVKARELLQQNQQDGEMHQLYAEAEKQQKMAKRKDYYKILGVDQSASTRDVKSVSAAKFSISAWGAGGGCTICMPSGKAKDGKAEGLLQDFGSGPISKHARC
jgi:hypothetical protein